MFCWPVQPPLCGLPTKNSNNSFGHNRGHSLWFCAIVKKHWCCFVFFSFFLGELSTKKKTKNNQPCWIIHAHSFEMFINKPSTQGNWDGFRTRQRSMVVPIQFLFSHYCSSFCLKQLITFFWRRLPVTGVRQVDKEAVADDTVSRRLKPPEYFIIQFNVSLWYDVRSHQVLILDFSFTWSLFLCHLETIVLTNSSG